MLKALRNLLLPALVLISATAAQAQTQVRRSLPGKTLKVLGSSQAGIAQPSKNVKNILKGIVTPPCPHIGKSLRVLMVYARVQHPALYRQSVKLRRTGFTQEQTRQWLEDAICSAEGF